MEKLKTALGFGGILSEHSIGQILDKAVLKVYKPEEHLLNFGEVAHDVIFLNSGILRIYDSLPSGEEVTKYFVRPNQFFGDIESFYSMRPCTNAIQAVTQAEVVLLSRSVWEWLSLNIPSFLIFTKTITEAALLNKIKDNDFLNYGTAEEKYRELLRRYPEIVQQVPLQYIATYLKITPQSLSRIRKGVGRE